jgi:hypothetical protein
VHIYLTEQAEKHRDDVVNSAGRADAYLRDMFSDEDFDTFLNVLATMQSLEPDYNIENYNSSDSKSRRNTNGKRN